MSMQAALPRALSRRSDGPNGRFGSMNEFRPGGVRSGVGNGSKHPERPRCMPTRACDGWSRRQSAMFRHAFFSRSAWHRVAFFRRPARTVPPTWERPP